jgi:acyl dehydratase
MKNLPRGTGVAFLCLGAITLDQLQRYAQASGDPNPIHVSPAAAAAAGLRAPIAHGMFIMGQFERLVREWRPACLIESLSAHFLRPLYVGDTLELGARPASRNENGSLALRLLAENSAGEIVAIGEATIATGRLSLLRHGRT